jgi:hypothetical protein
MELALSVLGHMASRGTPCSLGFGAGIERKAGGSEILPTSPLLGLLCCG